MHQSNQNQKFSPGMVCRRGICTRSCEGAGIPIPTTVSRKLQFSRITAPHTAGVGRHALYMHQSNRNQKFSPGMVCTRGYAPVLVSVPASPSRPPSAGSYNSREPPHRTPPESVGMLYTSCIKAIGTRNFHPGWFVGADMHPFL